MSGPETATRESALDGFNSSSSSSLEASVTTLLGVDTGEQTPLLKKDVGYHAVPAISIRINANAPVLGGEEDKVVAGVEAFVPGQATFIQTLLNVLGDLIGTGILASPIAIAHCGWVLGPVLLLIITGLTLWTLKIFIRIIEKDRTLRNFADVARYGLGPRAEKWVTVLFLGDCCIWFMALIVLFSDAFAVAWPIFSSNQWKVVGLAVIVPLNMIPLRFLSWTSGTGIICTWTLVGILVFTGLGTTTSPGSIFHPAHTDIFPSHGWIKLGLSFGLLISGFGGHFLIPNLIRDMKHPEKADRVCEIGYGIAMVIYAMVSVCGYLMFGTNVSDEVSRDLALTSTFSPFLSSVAAWMVAIIPLTKIPLALVPLTDLLSSWFNLHPTVFVLNTFPSYTDEPLSAISVDSVDFTDGYIDRPYGRSVHNRREHFKAVFRGLLNLVLMCTFAAGALVFPSFESLMSIMGGGMSVATCVIIPICAGAGVWGWRWYSRLICGLAVGICTVGVTCAFLNNGET